MNLSFKSVYVAYTGGTTGMIKDNKNEKGVKTGYLDLGGRAESRPP
jgi:hypothetical protein